MTDQATMPTTDPTADFDALAEGPRALRWLNHLTTGLPDSVRARDPQALLNLQGKGYLRVGPRLAWALEAWAQAVEEKFNRLLQAMADGDATTIRAIAEEQGYYVETELVSDVWDPLGTYGETDGEKHVAHALTRTVFKATVRDPYRNVATGHGSETYAGFKTGHFEKAETIAIGRAMLLLGFGTQWADAIEATADTAEGKLADSPVAPRATRGAQTRAATTTAPTAPTDASTTTTTTSRAQPQDPQKLPVTDATIAKIRALRQTHGDDFFKWALRGKLKFTGSKIADLSEYQGLLFVNNAASVWLAEWRQEQPQAAAAAPLTSTASPGQAPSPEASAAAQQPINDKGLTQLTYLRLSSAIQNAGGILRQEVKAVIEQVYGGPVSAIKPNFTEEQAQAAIAALQGLPVPGKD